MAGIPTSAPAAFAGILGLLVVNNLTMQNVLLAKFFHPRERSGGVGRQVAAGKFRVHQGLNAGFDTLPAALIGLLVGENIGKYFVQVP